MTILTIGQQHWFTKDMKMYTVMKKKKYSLPGQTVKMNVYILINAWGKERTVLEDTVDNAFISMWSITHRDSVKKKVEWLDKQSASLTELYLRK